MRGRALFVLAVCACVVAGCSKPPSNVRDATGDDVWFIDMAEANGLVHQHVSGFSGKPLLPEIVGGGAALADVDGDGDLDVYVVQSGRYLGDPENAKALSAPTNQLFLNRGDGHFAPADGGAAADRGYGMGVATGDYDNDGDVDLYVTNLGANVLLRNDGRGQFEDVSESAGVADPNWSTAAAFVDADGDGDLDLFVVNYLNWSLAVEKECMSRGRPTYCAPNTYATPAMDRFYRNNGDGTFTDVTLEAGINTRFGNGLGIAIADFDADGRADLFVANDGMADQLWINQGGLRFEDQADYWGVAVNNQGVATAGMGVSAADIDDDSDIDLIVVNFEKEADSLYLNEGSYFVDGTARAEIAATTRMRTRFGVAFVDFDNDGVFDLYEANGKVDGDPAARVDAFSEPDLLFNGVREADGSIRFREVPSSGMPGAPSLTSRALVVGDVNNDGAQDLLIVNRDAPLQLLINEVKGRGNWVRFRVLGSSGADALGAVVTCEAGTRNLLRTVTSTGSYLAAHDPRVHVGLGADAGVRNVQVLWADGARETFGAFEANADYKLQQGAGRQLRK